MLRIGILVALPAALFALASAASAQPGPAGEQDARLTAEAKRQRLEFLTETFGGYALAPAGRSEQPFDRSQEPLLHYNNPVRQSFSDAVFFLWLDGGRPRAAATIAIRSKGQVSREFSSLSKEPLECRGEAGERWLPNSAGHAEQDLPDAPAPKPSDKLRLVQMRQLAGRFRIVMKETATGESSELRLLSRPIYRFASEKAGVVDGALFAFAEGTDPEALLLLEVARGAGDLLTWRYTLTRMTSRPLEAELDGRQIWSVLSYWDNPRSPSNPYIEMMRGTYPLEP